MPASGTMGQRRTQLTSIQHDGQTYSIGDCVLINPVADAPAYVGRIRKISHKGDRLTGPADVEVDVTWFYRPEEAIGGRKLFHGQAELFDSDHRDKTPLGAIIGHCRVHTVDEYETLPERTSVDYFYRFKYLAATQKFKPDTVPVYCACELPYNPDQPMAMCDNCEDWFHPECLGLGSEVLYKEHFVCPGCLVTRSSILQQSSF